MINIMIDTCPGFDQWRDAARRCILNDIPPDQILWKTPDQAQDSLFTAADELPPDTPDEFSVSKDFIDLAETVMCHSDNARFDILYRLLWRIRHDNKNLLKIKTDSDVMAATKMVKAVRRDAYKITAFLRFREIELDGREHYIAWYEPDHYILQRAIGFFKTRFRNMNWSILTPYLSAHWNGQSVYFDSTPDKSLLPEQDDFEDYWLTYYASIFNPARPKKKAMLTQMPKKYWKNMPETRLIPDLLKTAEARTKEMIKKSGGGV